MKITANEFHAVFALSKTKMFNVSYYTLGSNKEPYFSTSADEFNRPKSDYTRCGQAQNDICKGYTTAMNFYKKWDAKHLSKLTDEEYTEMTADLEALFEKYPHILKQKESDAELRSFGFSSVRELSMTSHR